MDKDDAQVKVSTHYKKTLGWEQPILGLNSAN